MPEGRYSPLLTVIVATFNAADTLQQCITSVAQQTYPNKELIVIDGGSSDGTADLLKANRKHIDYWISEPDHGIYNAWNKGLKQANGEWICFLGADDLLWDVRVLDRVALHLEDLPSNIRVAYGKVMLLNSRGEILYPIGEPWAKVQYRFKQLMCIPHPGTMHRRILFEKHGNFDESFRISGDYELLMRELKTSRAYFMSEFIIAGMMQGGISSTPENALVQMREVRRIQRIHGQHGMNWLWLMAIGRIYLRLFLNRLVGDGSTRKILDIGRRLLGQPPYWTQT